MEEPLGKLVEIPSDLWAAANAEMNGLGNTKKSKKQHGELQAKILHFTYSLNDRQFVNYQVASPSNLFVELAKARKEAISSDYIVVQMDDHEGVNSLNASVTGNSFAYDVDPLREAILRSGIHVATEAPTNGSRLVFHLMGCSNSQLTNHGYFFRRATNRGDNEKKLLQVLPDLLKLEAKKGIPKRVKYAGLLFSGIRPIQLPAEGVVSEEIPSEERNGFDFTDGPGLISKKLAMWVGEKLRVKGKCPSVFQIRYCGMIKLLDGSVKGYVCKGILLIDPTDTCSYKIKVRKSMLKVKASEAACEELKGILGICDYSRATPGRLGPQQICLLSDVVDNDTFLELQKEHSNCVKNALIDPFAMAWMLALDKRPFAWDNFHKLIISELEQSSKTWNGVVPSFYLKCAEMIEKDTHVNTSIPTKVQLPLAASRTLFGAVFPEKLHSTLEEGECMVFLEDGPLIGNGSEETEDNKQKENYVIVSRSPSYHPGDIRVLRVVPLPPGHELLELRNCILFSTKGTRPEADKMGGGDLDGDKYLVIWHPVLLKYAHKLRGIPPAEYDDNPAPSNGDDPGGGPTLSSKNDWIHYAAMTDNSVLGEVESAFYKIAKKHGISSPEIVRLNKLFSRMVDRHPTSMGEFKRLKSSLVGIIPGGCVWEEMAALHSECVEQHSKRFHQQKESKFAKFFRQFRECGISNLHVQISGKFEYHFLETINRKKIERTVSALEASVRGVGEKASRDVEKYLVKFEHKIKRHEQIYFAQFYERVEALFDTSLSEIDVIIGKYRFLAAKELQKKLDLCQRFNKDKLVLESCLKALDDKQTQKQRQFVTWAESRSRHWASCQDNQQRKFEIETEAMEESLKNLIKKKLDKESQLRAIERELGSLWMISSFFFGSNTEAANRRRQVQSELEQLQHDHNFQQNALQSKRTEHAKESKKLKSLAEHELQKLKKSKLHERVCLFNQQKHLIHEKIEKLETEHSEALSGDRVRQILKQANEIEATNVVEKSRKEKLLQTAEELFCPLRLKEFEEKLAEESTRKKSQELGREHLRRSYKGAVGSWEIEVENGFSGPINREVKWDALVARLERVYTVEDQRLLGGFREGARSEPLPVYAKRAELQKHLQSSQALIITAGTGCGKSTQVPQYIADDFYSYNQGGVADNSRNVRICCTQPRRQAAQNIARRVAKEYGTTLGDLVGFRVGSRGRLKQDCLKTSENTRIEFVTEGLLLHNLAKSPEFIQQYDCVIIDEMHERNKEQDLCLSLLRDYLKQSINSHPSFKLVVMSASIDAQDFSKYLLDCPTMYCPGKMFHVEETHAVSDKYPDEPASAAVDVLFNDIIGEGKQTPGDVLIFLSGASEIDKCCCKIRQRAEEENKLVAAYPLYAKLDQETIDKAQDADHRIGAQNELSNLRGDMKDQVRKVICATNMAETSLTIDGVRFVIDSGRANKMRYDHKLRCEALSEDFISRASSIQRKGRAGRTASGHCFYLYSKSFHDDQMKEYDQPKILEECVDRLILFSLGVCQRNIEEMGLKDCPSLDDITDAQERLMDLDFIRENDEGRFCLTSDGQVASSLVSMVRPESVRMMLNSFKKYPLYAKSVMTLAVLLSSQDSVFVEGAEVHEEDQISHAYGDHLLALKHFQWFENASKSTKTAKLKEKCNEKGLNYQVLSAIQVDIETCHRELKKNKLFPSTCSDTSISEDQCLVRALISGYFSHIVRCADASYADNTGFKHLSARDTHVYLDRNSSLKKNLVSSNSPIFVQDDEAEEDKMNSDNDIYTGFGIVQDQVLPCFLLYGNLKTHSKINKTFMLDATVVDSTWVLEEAPHRWAERISFEIEQETICRVRIQHIGPKILLRSKRSGKGNFNDFFEEAKLKFQVDTCIADIPRNEVSIVGTQAAVEGAKDFVGRRLLSILEQFQGNDRVTRNDLGLRLEFGMEAMGKANPNTGGKTPFHRVFCAFGTNEVDFSSASNSAHFVYERHRSRILTIPIRGIGMSSVKGCLYTTLGYSQATTNSQNGHPFIIVPENDRFVVYLTKHSNSDMEILFTRLRNAREFACELVGCKAFKEDRQKVVVDTIAKEAQQMRSFWRAFRSEFLSGPPRCNMLGFIRSQSSFIFGPGDAKSAIRFRGKIVDLSSRLDVHLISFSRTPCRYQVRRLASILAEVRNQCPDVLFNIWKVNGGIEMNQENLRDHEFLIKMVKKREMESIQLAFVGLSKTGQTQARKLLKDRLSVEALETDYSNKSSHDSPPIPKASEQKLCVSCRRSVVVSLGKSENRMDNWQLKDGQTEGWNLTLCGCSYCRECFLYTIEQSLKDDTFQRATCQCCKRGILSEDCLSIVMGKSNGTHGDRRNQWNQLCRLAEANYCKTHEALITRDAKVDRKDRKRGWATCPDCDYSMVHPKGYLFFFCRNQKCRSKICTRCYKVATSQEESKQCANSKCMARDGDDE